jgi:septum formation protein
MKPILLASTSATRVRILESAGVHAAQIAPEVDEAPVKATLGQAHASAERAATALAELKACTVSARHPEAIVIGADQMLDLEGTWFDKPGERGAARRQLTQLRGRRHRLVTAVAVAAGGEAKWRYVETAALTMRPFSDAFLDAYLDRAGSAVLGCVGAYQLEGLGAQLFSLVEGDFFGILGLPLLPLLDRLRREGAIES